MVASQIFSSSVGCSYDCPVQDVMFDVLQALDVEEGIASVHEALSLGINFFDTSPFYGITRSEKVGFSSGVNCKTQMMPKEHAIISHLYV